jgi:hypothetical protein
MSPWWKWTLPCRPRARRRPRPPGRTDRCSRSVGLAAKSSPMTPSPEATSSTRPGSISWTRARAVASQVRPGSSAVPCRRPRCRASCALCCAAPALRQVLGIGLQQGIVEALARTSTRPQAVHPGCRRLIGSRPKPLRADRPPARPRASEPDGWIPAAGPGGSPRPVRPRSALRPPAGQQTQSSRYRRAGRSGG